MTLLKKPSDKSKRKKGKKRGPKYNHPGQTRNGFGEPDQIIPLELENCPSCESPLESVEVAPLKVQQVAEIVEQPVEIREYRRPFYQCPHCGWSGYSPMPLGIKEGFSYGGRLCSVVGWLGYGGNLTWLCQEYFVEYVLGVPISQGSLAKMQRWFQESLEPSYQQWLSYGGARSDWGAQLVAQMFSFLETMRLQGNNAIAELCELLSLAGRSPPGLDSI